MNDIMKPYIDLGISILEDSNNCDDRTGAGTYSIFGEMLKFDTRLGAPFLTERKLPLRSVAGELLWFLEGSTNNDVLKNDYRCSFWNEWTSQETQTIGPMYGKQWRDANGVDQLYKMVDGAIRTPNSRRLLVNTWIPDLIPDEETVPSDNPVNGKMALPPCHFAYQLRIYGDKASMNDTPHKWVDLMFHLRSSDYLIGLPNNIASYHMLQVMIASYLTKVTGVTHTPRYLTATLGDVHIYKNHIDACKILFTRKASAIVPMFNVKPEVLSSYLANTNGKISFNLDERTYLLREVMSGVTNYYPGEVIVGVRNV